MLLRRHAVGPTILALAVGAAWAADYQVTAHSPGDEAQQDWEHPNPPHHGDLGITEYEDETRAALHADWSDERSIHPDGGDLPSNNETEYIEHGHDGQYGGTGSIARPPRNERIVVYISNDADDGTEINDLQWLDNGGTASGCDYMGFAGANSYDAGLRFLLDGTQVEQGDSFVYARLVLPGTSDGQVTSGVLLRIAGVAADGVGSFDEARPSQLPKTGACVDWTLTTNWPDAAFDRWDCYNMPLDRYTPDISQIVNEIVQREHWGSGPEGKTLALVIEDNASAGINDLAFRDYYLYFLCADVPPLAARLELYPTVASTFVGPELLGRPTDHSVTVHALCLLELEAYFEYGTQPGDYEHWLATSMLAYPAEAPIEVVLDGLASDTQYHYRMRYRRPGEAEFVCGPDHSFHTQRPNGSTFTFTVQADSHLQGAIACHAQKELELYQRTLLNALADGPDFHIDLGDTLHAEYNAGRDAVDYQEVCKRDLDQRPYFGLLCHSAPLFLALGNHEAEQGWRLDGTPDNLAVWATNARKMFYPNPVPDSFYTGCTTAEDFVGLRQSYYAWNWGDALFVVLDPYWYTTTKPHHVGGSGSGDRWDWTLGEEQYDWLKQTLEQSDVTFKFVFAHQLTGGYTLYGRGGIEAVSHALGGQGSYEWGGENEDGTWGFNDRRPGWDQPIHQLMADANVAIFFHGHDHVFVKQDLDGIVYQTCPQPSDAGYGEGGYSVSGYQYGDQVNNSGHIRVTVAPYRVTVDYVRAYHPDDETPEQQNGTVVYSYSIFDCNANGVPDPHDLADGTSHDCNGNGIPDECEPGDVDGDGDVDLSDLATFALCFSNGATTPPPGCSASQFCSADLDDDGDVDLSDFATFALQFTG